MPNTISSVSIDDTLSLIQLARETALSQGRQAQASRLTPVVNDLRNLVSSAHDARPAQPAPSAQSAQPVATSGIMGQSDFRTLLEATQKKADSPALAGGSSPLERSQMVNAMASAEMSDVDIARQLGMSRDEVRMILSVNDKTKSIGR